MWWLRLKEKMPKDPKDTAPSANGKTTKRKGKPETAVSAKRAKK